MIKTLFTGRRGYWIGLGACMLALALVMLIWTIPALMRLRKTKDTWNHQTMELRLLKDRAQEIPSPESIGKQRDYRKWLGEQSEMVKGFFADRTTLLEAPLTGQEKPSPTEFEDAYIDATSKQRAWLVQNKSTMNVQDIPQAFVNYPWTTSAELTPNPSEFLPVLRDYWARVKLYTILSNSRATIVKRLDVRGAAPVNSLFDGIPFSLDVTLQAERVVGLLDQILSVSPSASNKPVIRLQAVTIQQELADGRPMVNVHMDGVILLLRRDATTSGGAS